MFVRRSMVSQLCGIFPYLCLQFTLGTTYGYVTIVVAELYKKDSEIPATIDQLTWYASLDVLKVVGSLITGGLLHRFGGRLVAVIAALLFTTSYLLYHYATSITSIYVSALSGLILVINSLSCPHTSEISEPQYRSSFLAMNYLSSAFGMFFSRLLGSFMYWRTIALINLLFPLSAAITTLVTPNSPVWFASKGRFDEAEKALCWLRGWVKPIDVQREFQALVVSVNQRQSTSLESVNWKERFGRFLQKFYDRSFYSPLGIITLAFIFKELCGTVVFYNYLTVVFIKIMSPIDQSIATMIAGTMDIIGGFFILLFIHRIGKRKLVTVSAIVSAFCFISTAVVEFLELQGDYLWIPTIATIVGALACNTGIGSIAYMLNSEVFPSSIRYLGTSIGMSISMILNTIMTKSFLYIIGAITLPVTFLIFGIANVVASVTYYFLFPETEGKSLKEIEDHFQASKHSNENNE